MLLLGASTSCHCCSPNYLFLLSHSMYLLCVRLYPNNKHEKEIFQQQQTILISLAIWEPKPSNFTSYLFHLLLLPLFLVVLASDNGNNLLDFFVVFSARCFIYKSWGCMYSFNFTSYFVVSYFFVYMSCDKTRHIFTWKHFASADLYRLADLFLVQFLLLCGKEKVFWSR